MHSYHRARTYHKSYGDLECHRINSELQSRLRKILLKLNRQLKKKQRDQEMYILI